MQLDIPAGDFAGYIFDCDGTLVDSMPLHYEAWCETLRRSGYNGKLDEDFFYSLGGVPAERLVTLLNEHHGLQLKPGPTFALKEAIFTGLLPRLQRIEPVAALAEQLHRTHPLAVASGGTRPAVERSLRLTGLDRIFPVVVTSEDVPRGKPAPDIFLLAAERMGVPPSRCLVFEDAGPGIAAAIAAGMPWVHVPSRPAPVPTSL